MPEGIGVGVSGGGDSLALCLMLKNAGIHFVGLHFNHNLRPEAAKEAKWLGKVFAGWGIPLVVGTWSEKPSAPGRGQMEARQARYDFFKNVCTEQNLRHVALAHTQDDVAETFLMRLFYGSGPQGLQAMPKRKALATSLTLHRPLLGVQREHLRSSLQNYGQVWLEDPSNYNTQFVRVRARYWLKSVPKLSGALVSLAESLTEVETLIEARLLSDHKEFESFDSENITTIPLSVLDIPHFARDRFFKKVFNQLGPSAYAPRRKKQQRLFEHLKSSEAPYSLGHIVWQRQGSIVQVRPEEINKHNGP